MKVILSRKGFDSEYGGSPSPLIEDEIVQSFPIPSSTGKKYKDLKFDKKNSIQDIF